ncbi:hypothetical protein [Polaribacter sp.]|uniref:hypothetical protein n=1 Tax=Polaribacter sp. TaxID=1920175 RepID=UPI003F6A291C
MKKTAGILAFLFVVTFTANAQQKRENRRPNFSVEQKTELAVKKLVLTLDLSEKQKNKVTPLILEQITKREATTKERRRVRAQNEKPSTDKVFEMQNNQLQSKIDFKNKMKQILDAEQFERFQKMGRQRNQRKKQMKRKNGMRKTIQNRMNRRRFRQRN